MDTKALFLDLDGTLLNDAKELSPGNRSAMEQALALGHRLIITTGRPLVSARLQAQRLGLDGPGCYVIAYNGGVIYDLGQEKLIFQQCLPREPMYAVFDHANACGLHIQTYDDTAVLVQPQCEDDDLLSYCRKTLMEYRVIQDIRRLKSAPVKLLAISTGNEKPLKQLQSWLQEQYAQELDSFFSTPDYLEIVPHGLNKGRALLQLAELLHIPWENTLAAGDAANDSSMLLAAKIGVAMCNGTEEVKALADVVTPLDNNHDGVAWIIQQYLL